MNLTLGCLDDGIAEEFHEEGKLNQAYAAMALRLIEEYINPKELIFLTHVRDLLVSQSGLRSDGGVYQRLCSRADAPRNTIDATFERPFENQQILVALLQRYALPTDILKSPEGNSHEIRQGRYALRMFGCFEIGGGMPQRAPPSLGGNDEIPF